MRAQEQFEIACESGNDELAKDLLFENWDEIDINATDDKGSTILMRAALFGHYFVVQWLVEVAGVELDHQNELGSTALMFAAVKGDVNSVACLLANGANFRLTTKNSKTAYDLAKSSECRELIHDYKYRRRIPQPRSEGHSRRLTKRTASGKFEDPSVENKTMPPKHPQIDSKAPSSVQEVNPSPHSIHGVPGLGFGLRGSLTLSHSVSLSLSRSLLSESMVHTDSQAEPHIDLHTDTHADKHTDDNTKTHTDDPTDSLLHSKHSEAHVEDKTDSSAHIPTHEQSHVPDTHPPTHAHTSAHQQHAPIHADTEMPKDSAEDHAAVILPLSPGMQEHHDPVGVTDLQPHILHTDAEAKDLSLETQPQSEEDAMAPAETPLPETHPETEQLAEASEPHTDEAIETKVESTVEVENTEIELSETAAVATVADEEEALLLQSYAQEEYDSAKAMREREQERQRMARSREEESESMKGARVHFGDNQCADEDEDADADAEDEREEGADDFDAFIDDSHSMDALPHEAGEDDFAVDDVELEHWSIYDNREEEEFSVDNDQYGQNYLRVHSLSHSKSCSDFERERDRGDSDSWSSSQSLTLSHSSEVQDLRALRLLRSGVRGREQERSLSEKRPPLDFFLRRDRDPHHRDMQERNISYENSDEIGIAVDDADIDEREDSPITEEVSSIEGEESTAEEIMREPMEEMESAAEAVVDEPAEIEPVVEEMEPAAEPVVEEPAEVEPVVEEPDAVAVVEKSTKVESTVDEPVVEEMGPAAEPVVEEPAEVEPVVEEPSVDVSNVVEPVTEEIAVTEPVVVEMEPVVDESEVNGPTSAEVVASEPFVEKVITLEPSVGELAEVELEHLYDNHEEERFAMDNDLHASRNEPEALDSNKGQSYTSTSLQDMTNGASATELDDGGNDKDISEELLGEFEEALAAQQEALLKVAVAPSTDEMRGAKDNFEEEEENIEDEEEKEDVEDDLDEEKEEEKEAEIHPAAAPHLEAVPEESHSNRLQTVDTVRETPVATEMSVTPKIDAKMNKEESRPSEIIPSPSVDPQASKGCCTIS